MNIEINKRSSVSAQIKPGYKKTPIGIIPEDWEVKKLDDIGEFHKGKGISKSQLVEKGLNAIRYGEIYTVHHYFIKRFYSFIEEFTAKDSFPLISGDILFAGSGETLEEIGKSVAFIGDEKVFAGGDLIVLRPKKDSCNSKFLGFITNEDVFKRQTFSVGQGNAVVHIYPSNLKRIQLPIPPLSEQKSIAACLSTWDLGIEKLTQLIQAKKQQKKGLMQQLFNGELSMVNGQLEKVEDKEDRLKGWEKIELSECLKYKQPTKYLEKEFNNSNEFNKTPVLTANQSFILGYTANEKGVYQKYPVIIFDDFTTASRYINFPFKVKSSAIKFLKEKDGYNLKFMFELLQTIKQDISTHKRRWISEFSIKVVKIPPLEEQTAIAEILSTADKEIDLLEQKLSAFQAQKKGLMQVLLTGEKRLV